MRYKGLENIRAVAPDLARQIAAEGGMLTKTDIETLAKLLPHLMVLVRSNMGRFTTPLQNVMWYTGIISQHYEMTKEKGLNPLTSGCDYIRDVALIAE